MLSPALFDSRVFLALVEAFAAFASPIAVMSGFWAFVAWATYLPGTRSSLGERVANAVNYGIVCGFPAGFWFGALTFAHYDRLG